jgi:hypothetical protein
MNEQGMPEDGRNISCLDEILPLLIVYTNILPKGSLRKSSAFFF